MSEGNEMFIHPIVAFSCQTLYFLTRMPSSRMQNTPQCISRMQNTTL